MSIASAMSGISAGRIPHQSEEREPAEHDGGGEHSDVHEHLKAMQAKDGGSHMHIHSDGMSHTTHHVHEGGEVQGPHEHPDEESLKAHVGKFAAGEDVGQGEHEDDSIFGE